MFRFATLVLIIVVLLAFAAILLLAIEARDSHWTVIYSTVYGKGEITSTIPVAVQIGVQEPLTLNLDYKRKEFAVALCKLWNKDAVIDDNLLTTITVGTLTMDSPEYKFWEDVVYSPLCERTTKE